MVVRAIFGDGAGKTTSALGHCVRSLGNGSDSVIIVQFMKSDDTVGEYEFFKTLEPVAKCKIIQYGVNCVHPRLRAQKRCMECGECSKNIRLNKTKVQWAIQHLTRKHTDFDVVILDEILVALSMGYITTKEIEELVALDTSKKWILTGRIFGKYIYNEALDTHFEIYNENKEWLNDFADYVAEIVQHKHPYNKGVKAKRGEEY